MDRCLGLGKQYLLQQRIQSASSISKVLFQTALKVAGNRGLLEGDDPAELLRRREAAAVSMRDLVARIDIIDAFAAERRSQWLA